MSAVAPSSEPTETASSHRFPLYLQIIVAMIVGNVFLQVWIGADDKLPRLMRAIYLNDPLEQRYAVVLSDWKLDVDVPAGAFATEKTASATHIPFKSPYEPPMAKASAKGKSPSKSATPAVK